MRKKLALTIALAGFAVVTALGVGMADFITERLMQACDPAVTYINLLLRLLKHTETDEVFRARQFRELARGFQKFGPAAATPSVARFTRVFSSERTALLRS